ncbi:hypothetical protein AHAS_Ahas12G0025500 [Arachis hypogaea]
MAEALLSGFINVVVKRLISPEFVNLVVGKKLDRKLVEKLKTAILAAEALVADAEQKQFGNDRVRKWLDSLRDALYTADDLLDRLFIKAEIRNKARIRRPHFLDLSVRKMVTKIEDVVKRIEDLEKLKHTIGLEKIQTGGSSWRPPSTSLVKGNVFGRDDDQQALMKMLNDNNHHNLSVISIVGMGGVGKTTLAQWLYNNKDLMHRVDLKAWICVSDNFDVVETTKNVIKGISSGCSKLTVLPNGLYNLVNLRHLDIRSIRLKEMPKRMGKLKQLHILSKFVVGKQKDNGIEELGGLLNLHGSLEIQKLENVVDANQARSARIIDKKHIQELLLEWCLDDEMVSNTNTDEQDILQGLQPHRVLKVLTIKQYKGKMFPDWLGRCSYSNITSVSLESCKNCCMLPSLGQLPSLKSLRIERFDELKSIGMEFYKNEGHQHSSPIAPFPSLERLVFDEMSCWEEWHLPDSEAFPQLKSLQITDCRMLKEDMVNQVLMRIVSSSSDVSKVRQLEIREYHEGWGKHMRLDGDRLSISGFECVVEYAFKSRIIHHLTSLQEIQISRCSSVASLGGNCLSKSLQKLTISNCRELEFLQQQQKYDLVELHIVNSCDSLTSLSLDSFPNLENLEIRGCSNLESVSKSEPPHAALQHLTITSCPNLTHFDVSYCDKLVALPRDMNTRLPNLHSLHIQGCPNICRLSGGGLPSNLKELRVGDCEEQVRGLSWLGNLDNLTHLTISGIRCESIKSYPEVGSLPRLPSLTTLHISKFHNLETLECNELLRLTSLQQLHIHWCPNLENMAGEKLPSSLLLLKIERCPLLGERCKKNQQIWPTISHIPAIEVID